MTPLALRVVVISVPAVNELDDDSVVTLEPIVTAFTPPVTSTSTPITTALFA